jgi:SAM-dependent methyltransferase
LSLRRISKEKVKELYNGQGSIWEKDSWHAHTKRCLDEIVGSLADVAAGCNRVLHVGSAGDGYGLLGRENFHMDLAERRLSGIEGAIVGDLHQIPVAPAAIDLCTCVGNVLNYCDAAVAIAELANILVPGGWLILEFETSDSWEYFGSPAFRQSAARVETFYGDDPATALWVYSLKYASSLLTAHGLNIRRTRRVHVASSLVYKMTGRIDVASRLSVYDKVLEGVPGLSAGASNIILFCQKGTSAA